LPSSCHRYRWHRWQIMGTISGCWDLKVNMFEDFFHLPQVSTTTVVHLELRISPRILEKIRNGPNGIRTQGLGGKWFKKSKISWHCPFKLVIVIVVRPSLADVTAGTNLFVNLALDYIQVFNSRSAVFDFTIVTYWRGTKNIYWIVFRMCNYHCDAKILHKHLFIKRNGDTSTGDTNVLNPVLRIRDILGWIRIRGSMPLTNGSGCGSCHFRHWPSRRQQNTNLKKSFSAFYFLKVHLHHFSKIKSWTEVAQQ
jgi:hypothetical protein